MEKDIDIHDEHKELDLSDTEDIEIPMGLKFCKEADIVKKRQQFLRFKFVFLAKVEKMRYQGNFIDTMNKIENHIEDHKYELFEAQKDKFKSP